MEKLVSAMASLHAALTALSEMEAAERKMKRRNKAADFAAQRCVFLAAARSVFNREDKAEMVEYPGHVYTYLRPNKIRLYSRKSNHFFNDWADAFEADREKAIKNNRVSRAAGPSTLGGCGLPLLYANVILLVEKYLDSNASISRDERESLYQMLPENLKALVRAKLSKNINYGGDDDAFLGEGWRAATVEIMGWWRPWRTTP